MIVNEENPAPAHEAAPEEEALLGSSSAPTLRDLRGAAKDLFMTIETEPDPASSDDRPKQQAP
jgi:hypothetical protein